MADEGVCPWTEADQTEAQNTATEKSYLQIKPVSVARGHTGYLTFARRIVDVADVPQSEPPLLADEA